MAKGFAKGLVTGVAGTVAADAGAVYAFKRSDRTRGAKSSFIEENRKKQLVAAYHVKKQRSWDYSQLLFLFF